MWCLRPLLQASSRCADLEARLSGLNESTAALYSQLDQAQAARQAAEAALATQRARCQAAEQAAEAASMRASKVRLCAAQQARYSWTNVALRSAASVAYERQQKQDHSGV